MFIPRREFEYLKERVQAAERAASDIKVPFRDHTVFVLCKHGKEARRVRFFDPPPVEFVQDGEVLKYVGENKEQKTEYIAGLPYTLPPTYLPVYQSSKCSLTCERDGNVLNR